MRYVSIGVRVPVDVEAKLKLRAEADGKKVSAYVRDMIVTHCTEEIDIPEETENESDPKVLSEPLPLTQFSLLDEPTTITDRVGEITVYIAVPEQLVFYVGRRSNSKVLYHFDNEWTDDLWSAVRFLRKKIPITYRLMKQLRDVMYGEPREFYAAEWWYHYWLLVNMLDGLNNKFKEDNKDLLDEIEILEDMPISKQNADSLKEAYTKLRWLEKEAKRHPKKPKEAA